jgi:hypothetical protein
MIRKLPPDEAFTFYLSLGLDRSYQAVADHFGTSKSAVYEHAAKHQWTARIEAQERQAREKTDAAAVETREAMSQRHLKILRAITQKALTALQSMPLASSMDAVRALHMVIANERLVRGEATERTEIRTIGELARLAYDEEQAAIRSAAAAEAEEQAEEQAADGPPRTV